MTDDNLKIFYGDYAPDMLLADLHVHTRFSDGWWAPERLAEAAVARGLSAIGITDHDGVAGGYAVADYCARRNLPLIIYPGSEVTARRGQSDVHVLGLDLTADVRPWQSVEAAVDDILRQGGFVVMPHPRAPSRGQPSFDQILALHVPVAVEIFNAAVGDLRALSKRRGHDDANLAARDFYLAHRDRLAGAVGGTDAHFRTVGRGLTAYRGDLRAALAAGQTAVLYRPERERLLPWDPIGYFTGLRRLARRRRTQWGADPNEGK
ncbi:MAG: PHP domain-containing protein [Thermomicrobiales bacterium]